MTAAPQPLEELVALLRQGRHAQALRAHLAPGWAALGIALLQQGRAADAREALRCALRLRPDDAETLTNLGAAVQQSGCTQEAESHYRAALRLKPDHPEACNNLANVLAQAGRLHEAEVLYRAALRVRPAFAQAHDNLGAALQDLGRFVEAEASYRAALQADPGFTKAHSDLLLCLNFTDRPVSYCLDQARAYGRAVATPAHEAFKAWHCPPDARRLRVGLVSGDLREHPVGYFLESLLQQLDPEAIELLAYTTTRCADSLTQRIRPRFAAWRSIAELDDRAAAGAIHDDAVHILLDLSGHTAGNRLPVFARKPAPLQASWLGYFASTGLREMDYVLLDTIAAPPGDTPAFTETIHRLPGPRYCFTAPAGAAPVGPLPAAREVGVTFACFNTLNKINGRVATLWARVLRALPGSRLFLKARLLQDPRIAAEVVQRFEAHGVAAHRLLLEGWSPRAEYLAAYGRADIALDPFPYTGGTTTLEALWMGVPVLTLRGDRLLSRQGESILICAGLPDWIAEDEDDYVARAVRCARDLPGLAALRGGLRQRLAASPLLDAAGFARDFEAALRDLWTQSAVIDLQRPFVPMTE